MTLYHDVVGNDHQTSCANSSREAARKGTDEHVRGTQ